MATFTAAVQSGFKLRLTFSEPMDVNADFIDRANYQVTALDGTDVAIDSIERVGPDDTRCQLLLGDGLDPFAYYNIEIGSLVKTMTGDAVSPNRTLVQWKEVVPRPIRIEFFRFSGEVSGGILGSPAGQVFFSPAYGEAAANSIIEVESVEVCTRAYDVYTIPALVDPAPLFTFPAATGASSLIGPLGGVLIASAHRLGQAVMVVSDMREEDFPTTEDGPAEGLLREPIDITRASFLNDGRWRTFPGSGATLGAFMTADNQTPIGPGPVTGPFSIP